MGIELERTVGSIQVGTRHRTDLGDIDTLAASIREHGLLQPITVAIDGVLVCGRRRLAAIRQLGWRHRQRLGAQRHLRPAGASAG